MCSQIFSHLTLLNQHKRTHNQDDSHSDTVTVVTQNQGIIQAQNLISESGHNLGQIQIVATDSLEPAQLHHSLGEPITMVQQHQHQKGDKNKCITCGGHIQQNAKRKGPKLIRCETCIQNDANAQNVRPTQIFVSPEGDIKFEVNEMNQIQIQNTLQKVQPKKKNVTTVTKCTTCNGTGVVIVTETPTVTSPVTTAQSSTKLTTARTVTTSSPQKIQQVQIQQIKEQPASPPPLQIHHQVQHHAPPANQGARQSE